jgi:formamidopyrimidine-DNA glycosylase
MPELPEVETIRRGLAPRLEGATIVRVVLNRPDLRFPFPPGFARALEGRVIERVERRGKYLLIRLDSGRTWVVHLGMTGTFRFADGPPVKMSGRYYEAPVGEKHDHVLVALRRTTGAAETLIFSDARRFGFMDHVSAESDNPGLGELGPEPLSNAFSAPVLAERLRGKATPIKAALLDQHVVAGLGNIYVSEALHRAGIRPQAIAGTLVTRGGKPTARLEALAAAIPAVLREAIEHGGSTLRDFKATDGAAGGFQNRFAVYDRAGEPCPKPGCRGIIRHIVQASRSSYYCPVCQR